ELRPAPPRRARRRGLVRRRRSPSARRGGPPRRGRHRRQGGTSLRDAAHASSRRRRHLSRDLFGVQLARRGLAAPGDGRRAPFGALKRRIAVSTSGPRDAFVSPRFGQVATFMLLPAAASPSGLDVALLGIPYDGGTSYRTGARFGPRAVREQSSLIRPWHPVLKVHPFERLRVADCGDVDVAPISIERTYAAIEHRVNEILAHGAVPVSGGGDLSVTLPIRRSLARRRGPLGLVHFDAHPDTWDEYFGSKFFHGAPFRRAVEEGLLDPRRMVQVGIRGPLYGSEDFAFHEQ